MKMLPTWWDDIKHFKPVEFDSPDAKGSGGEHMDEHFVRDLDVLRSLYGKAMVIKPGGGYRTATYNSKIGGHPNSLHMKGMAADIRIHNGIERGDIVRLAIELGFKGIGVYDKHIHLDSRATKYSLIMWPGKSK